ncbi:MAG: hypothetical protein U1F24_00810 [Alphaproteobacteria bacterium]
MIATASSEARLAKLKPLGPTTASTMPAPTWRRRSCA